MKKQILAAAIFAACTAAPAMAQMYVGAGAGASKTDSHETSWKLYGGFQFSPNWGIELGYTDLGRYLGARADAWSLAGTGTMPLSPNWSLLGKLGVTSNHARFAGAGEHRTGLLAGIGVGYSLTKNVGVRLEYEDFGKLSKNGIGNNSHGNNIGLSVKYSF
jgi:OOP family OmpA-OmpF porin